MSQAIAQCLLMDSDDIIKRHTRQKKKWPLEFSTLIYCLLDSPAKKC